MAKTILRQKNHYDILVLGFLSECGQYEQAKGVENLPVDVDVPQSLLYPTHLLFYALHQSIVFEPESDNICAICGLPVAETKKWTPSSSFIDWTMLRGDQGWKICPACEIVMDKRVMQALWFRPYVITMDGVTFFTEKEVPFGQAIVAAERATMRQILLHPPEGPWIFYLPPVPPGNYKHVLPKTTVNFGTGGFWIYQGLTGVFFPPIDFEPIFEALVVAREKRWYDRLKNDIKTNDEQWEKTRNVLHDHADKPYFDLLYSNFADKPEGIN